ncbi:hypothetical protein MJT46_008611 [Ovis ammon polii x Ovis aries]|nr:hypothetical protein MJT46_008611 [Ovis ammon polii x Ovis aries]
MLLLLLLLLLLSLQPCSVYEMFGNECCLSTGEVIKITDLKIKKIMAEICGHVEGCVSPQSFELPMNFPGLFKIVADTTPYLTMEEITKANHIRPSRLNHPCFYHQKDIKLENLIIKQGERIMLNSVEEINGEIMVDCSVLRNHQNHSFALPLSQEGEFYECEDEHIYTLKEIIQWKIPKNRTRTVILTGFSAKWDSTNPFPRGFYGAVILKPVYEIQGVMKFRKDIVRILPSLDVEVKDITDSYDANWFLQVLSTQDLYEMANKEFPIVAEVIEAPQGNQLPISILQPGKTIVIHKKCQASKILASEIRSNSSKRHFLIPTSYKGKFKRRPREFPTPYDLKIAKSEKEPLHVVATKAFHSPFEELSSVSVGDEFLVHHSQTTEVFCEGIKKVMDVLVCEKILKNSHEAALLPLYMDGGFVEVIHDKKLYQISELCAQFRLPFNVKVSVRDLFIEKDILAAIPGLQLEESITNSYLLISDFANPKECWEIPVGRVNMTVQLVNNFSGDTGSFLVSTLVEEITEEQYYLIRRHESSFLHPPPRPPKHPSVEKIELTSLSLAKERTVDLPKSPKPKHRPDFGGTKGPLDVVPSEVVIAERTLVIASSVHVDRSKKLYSNQAGLDSKVRAGCQNDLADLEKEKKKTEATAVTVEMDSDFQYPKDYWSESIHLIEDDFHSFYVYIPVDRNEGKVPKILKDTFENSTHPGSTTHENDNYPPFWGQTDGDIAEFPVQNNKIIVDPWKYMDRLRIFKILITESNKYFASFGKNDTGNVFWALTLLYGRLFKSGISYYVVIMYFLAAIESEFLGNLPYEVELLSREEYRSNFCYSVEECRAAYPQTMDIHNRFYKYLQSRKIVSTTSGTPQYNTDEDTAIFKMWAAHQAALDVAKPKFRDVSFYSSETERDFTMDFLLAAEFIEAVLYRPYFESSAEFLAGFPHRLLTDQDRNVLTSINYYVLIMYFLAAIESEFLGNLPYEVELLSRKEYRPNFCYSVEECRAAYPQAMDIANRFYKVWYEIHSIVYICEEKVHMTLNNMSKMIQFVMTCMPFSGMKNTSYPPPQLFPPTALVVQNCALKITLIISLQFNSRVIVAYTSRVLLVRDFRAQNPQSSGDRGLKTEERRSRRHRTTPWRRLFWPKSKCYDYLYQEAEALLKNFPIQATISFYEDSDSEDETEELICEN